MSMVRRASLPGANHNGSGKEKLRTKTPSVNDLSKKFKNTPRGKRRLEFQPKQPLKDKKFYLDLRGYKKIPSLAARIKELGGKVEEFFNKDITYLITNHKDADTGLSPRSNSTPSPGMSVPSPLPVNKSSSRKGSALPSPISADSPQSIDTHQTLPKLDTRGRTLQKQATLMSTTKFGTSNVLTNAKAWGISVVHLDKVLEKLAEYGPSKVDKQPSIKELRSGKKELRVEIKKLQVPFIKVEDQSRHYQPLVKEFKEWPLLNFNTPVGTCPFDSPKENKESELKRKIKEKDNQEAKKQNKKGYCECCCMHYDALDLHLKGDHHKAFASSDSNYDRLDKLIKQGPSLGLFLDKVQLKYSSTQSTEPPISKNKVDSTFQTPTKKPVNLIDDAIIAKEVKDIIGENLTAKTDEEMTNHGGVHNTDVENNKTDDLCVGALSGAKDNSPASAQEGSTDLPARRKTRSQDSAYPEVKSHSPNVFIGQKTLDSSRHTEGENENHEFIVQNAELSSQKAASPDQFGALEEKADEQGDNGIQEPSPKVSFTSVKPHKTDDHEGNRRALTSQKNSNFGSGDGPEGDKSEVPKRALRGQRKDPGSTDCDENELPKQVLRSQRQSPESTNGDESIVPQRLSRRSQRKSNLSSDSTDRQEQEVPKRALTCQRKTECGSDSTDRQEQEVPKQALRCQRKTICSSDSTETLTSLEGLRHSPAKHDFGIDHASSTDTLPEKGNPDAVLQDSSRAGSKILQLQQNGITGETSSEHHKTQEEDDTRKDAEAKEDFSSPKSGLNDTKHRDHETMISDDSDRSDSDESAIAKVGDRFPQKLVTPLSIWSKLPECKPKKENPDELLNEALDQQNKTGDQEVDGIAKIKDDDFNALFNSDDDDDKSFEGFDVPHFGGSRSSEQDYLTYQIKKIVEYYTESQDDTLVNTTNEEVEDQEGKTRLTRGTEKKTKKKRKQRPHGIKIILSSRTDEGDDSVFQDDYDEDEDEDEDVDDECDDDEEWASDDDDDSSSTVADSTDGEDEELLSSSALCMDSFTYKRKSWNLEDDDIGLHLPVKRRRTITDEDSSLHSAEDQEAGDQSDSDVESRRMTRASTRLLSTKDKSGHKSAHVDVGDNTIDTGSKKTTRSTRTSTRTSTSKSNGMPRHARVGAENTVRSEERRNARTSPRRAQSDKKISNEQGDDEDVPIKDVSHKESNKATKLKTRSSSRISNASSDHKENHAANTECDSRNDENSTRRKTRATKVENNINSDNLSLEKGNVNKETRRKRRSSERASCTKERTLDDGKDIHEKPRYKFRASKDLSSTKEEEEDQFENDEANHTRITRRNRRETTVDLRTKNDQQLKTTDITSEKKENYEQKTAESEVPPSTPTTSDVAKNDSLSSSVMGDTSCTSDSSFLKRLPQDLVKILSVHTSIEERVKLRTRNKIKPEPTPVRQNTVEKRKEANIKGKSDLQVVIVDSGKASSKKHDIKTESNNVAGSSNNPRLRSRSLNKVVENSKNFTKSRNLRGASVASPPQRKPLSSASSSLDTSPVVTPIQTRRHWIFDPGHFSSSTPQPLRKVKTSTSPKTENRLMTTRALRDANKCLMAGDRYEFVDEDVFAFDD